MSAQSVLAGLMPPLENKNVLPIPWQPVAINTLARNDDTVSCLYTNYDCIIFNYILLYSCWRKRRPALNMKIYFRSFTKIRLQNWKN